MEYLENLPWIGELIHPVSQKRIIHKGVVDLDAVAMYWKLNSDLDNLNPVVINHPMCNAWWKRVLTNHPDLTYDEFSELLYGIDGRAMGIWDNFLLMELDEVEPDVTHIVVCVLDEEEDDFDMAFDQEWLPENYQPETRIKTTSRL